PHFALICRCFSVSPISLSPCVLLFFSYLYFAPRDLHSFPTRRSSDLDLHRPFIDELTKAHEGCAEGGTLKRVEDVLDVWFDSGSDRKSTRLNSSHVKISYAVFCLKKKNQQSTYHTVNSIIH